MGGLLMKPIIVDGPFLAHRSYHAPYRLFTVKGTDGTMLHSFMRTLNALRKKYKPKKFIVAWESHGTVSWRRELYPNYKPKETHNKRKVFWDNIKDVQIFLYLLGVEQYYAPHNEADDVIATLVNNGYRNSLVFTIDKDMMQLVDEKCHVCRSVKEEFGPKEVKKKYGVTPDKIPDLLAIWGDKIDSIEGINGYGIKKSNRILNKYGCIENIDESCTIHKYMNRMKLNKKLTTLNKKCNLQSVPNKDFKTKETLESILDKYELVKMKENLSEIKLIGNKGGIDAWIN